MTEARRYRKRPVVIEARQWTGENTDAIVAWVTSEHFYTTQPGLLARLYVAANDSWLTVEAGEWIIRDVAGFYPCKPDIFEATYELVSE